MRAAVITRPGGPEVLEIRDVPAPRPAAGEVLVRVRTAGVNRADLLQRQGRYPAPPGSPTQIPGLEFAGEVAELGPSVSRYRVGDRVFGIVGGGAQAEYLVTHERTVAPVPDALAWLDAGGVPEVFITAYDALVTQARVQSGDQVLVHAVGSGVGLAAIQLARVWDAVPFGTSRTHEKLERARGYGLEAGLEVGESLDGIAAAVAQWTNGRGIDVTLDLVGGAYVGASLLAAAMKARIIVIGTTAGRSAEIPLGALMSKRASIRGTMLRSRGLDEKIAVTSAFAADVVPLLARGALRPATDSVFPLAEIAKAHARVESNATFGKVVLDIG